MNKISDFGNQGIRLNDWSYAKKLEYTKKRLERQLWDDFNVNSRNNESDYNIREIKKFEPHPQRLRSDTDNSLSNSSRRVSLSSNTTSNLSIEVNHNYLFEQNKLKIKSARKKLNKKFTCTRDRFDCDIDVDIGDSCSITPRNTIFNYDDNKRKIGTNIKSAPSISNVKKISSKSPMQNQPPQRQVLTDGIFEQKLKLLVEKSLHTISDIRSVIERGIDQPDGDEDISRRLLRVKEFSNRFSRNYLYPIARQLEDLGKIKSPSSSNPNQRLLTAYQTVLNGLQAYLKHLPSSIGGCSSDKLNILLKHILDLCDVHSKMVKESDENGFTNLINILKLNAELTLHNILDHFTAISTESVLKSTTTKISLPQYRSHQKINKKNKSKHNIAERLSMYCTTAAFRRDPMWKKTQDSLTKKRFDVKSRYKTSTLQHRPPLEKIGTQMLRLPSKCKLFPKKSSRLLKKTPITTPVNEDNITTMVQMENILAEEVEEEKKKPDDDHEELVVKFLQLVLEEGDKNAAGVDGKKISDILDRLRTGADAETLRKIIEGLRKRRRNEDDGRLELKVVASHERIGGNSHRKEATVTVTGPKNAKLICITDENSVTEVEDDSESKDHETEKPQPTKITSSHTQTDLRKNKKNKATQRPVPTSMPMQRVTKKGKCLKMLPKDHAVNVIQYKLDFHKHCKSNPMYRKTTNILPWMLMSKVSDEIVDFALLCVAREIEVNDIVDRIYQSELQP